MARPCPICASRYREEIEQRLQAKDSVRAISAWLQNEKGEHVTKDIIWTHGRSHMALQSELGKQLAAVVSLPTPPPSPLFLVPQPAPSGPLSPLDTLAKTQEVALRLVDKLSAEMLDDALGNPVAVIVELSPVKTSLLIAALKEARTSAKNRHELVYGKKLVIDAKVETHAALKGLSTDELTRKRDELRRGRS